MSERDCGAVNGRFVCNRQPGHDGCHEERAENGGAIGWVPEPLAPAERERIAREATVTAVALVESEGHATHDHDVELDEATRERLYAIIRAALDAAAQGGELITSRSSFGPRFLGFF